MWTDGAAEEVHEALDLCLACKGCKSDCPVSVDMATYKSEFLSHHYAGPVAAAAATTRWAGCRCGRGWPPSAPGAANALTHAPGLRRLGASLAGVDPQRTCPASRRRRFTDAYRRRGPPAAGDRGPVLLWPDTFTNSLRTADPGGGGHRAGGGRVPRA